MTSQTYTTNKLRNNIFSHIVIVSSRKSLTHRYSLRGEVYFVVYEEHDSRHDPLVYRRGCSFYVNDTGAAMGHYFASVCLCLSTVRAYSTNSLVTHLWNFKSQFAWPFCPSLLYHDMQNQCPCLYFDTPH